MLKCSARQRTEYIKDQIHISKFIENADSDVQSVVDKMTTSVVSSDVSL